MSVHITLLDQYGIVANGVRVRVSSGTTFNESLSNSNGICIVNHFVGSSNHILVSDDRYRTYERDFTAGENSATGVTLNISLVKSNGTYSTSDGKVILNRHNDYKNGLICEFDYRRGLELSGETLNVSSYVNGRNKQFSATFDGTYTIDRGVKNTDGSTSNSGIGLTQISNDGSWLNSNYSLILNFIVSTQTTYKILCVINNNNSNVDSNVNVSMALILLTDNRLQINLCDLAGTTPFFCQLSPGKNDLILCKNLTNYSIVVNNVIVSKFQYNSTVNQYKYISIGGLSNGATSSISSLSYKDNISYFSILNGSLDLSSYSVGQAVPVEHLYNKTYYELDVKTVNVDSNMNIKNIGLVPRNNNPLPLVLENDGLYCKHTPDGNSYYGTISIDDNMFALYQESILTFDFIQKSSSGDICTILSFRKDITYGQVWGILYYNGYLYLNSGPVYISSINLNQKYNVLLKSNGVTLDVYLDGVYKSSKSLNSFDPGKLNYFDSFNTSIDTVVSNVKMYLGNQLSLPDSPSTGVTYFIHSDFETSYPYRSSDAVMQLVANRGINSDLVSGITSWTDSNNNIWNSGGTSSPTNKRDGVYFDGNKFTVSDINIGSIDNLSLVTNIKFSDLSNNDTVIFALLPTNSVTLSLGVTNYNKLRFIINSPSGYTVCMCDITLDTATNYDVLLSKSGSTLTAYINGILDSTHNGIPYHDIPSPTNTLTIGSYYSESNTKFSGYIKNFYLLNKAIKPVNYT